MFKRLLRNAWQRRRLSVNVTHLLRIGALACVAVMVAHHGRISSVASQLHQHRQVSDIFSTIPPSRNCTMYYPTFRKRSWSQHCFQPRQSANKLPRIAVMVAVTTRNVVFNQPSDLPLFKYLLPSLWQTVECGYDYRLTVGYDEGDGVFDTPDAQALVAGWIADFRNCIPLEVKLNIGVELVRVQNDQQKPGPVFIKMAQAAYELGADYFYRVNDDTELIQPWATPFIQSLEGLGPPYGVVGPLCNQGNSEILTHDFTHRMHMDIFDQLYYPMELSDWWMDDWISHVYGPNRTRKMTSIGVVHHSEEQKSRYQVDWAHRDMLRVLVAQGQERIRKWMTIHR